MSFLLAAVILGTTGVPGQSKSTQEDWMPYTSIAGRIRFEMPLSPVEQRDQAPSGGSVRIYACEKDDVLYEVVTMELVPQLQQAMQEAMTDSEPSLTRQILDQSVDSFIEGTEGKIGKTEYQRFRKLPSRTTMVKLSDNREAKVMSSVGRERAYLFLAAYPSGEKSLARATRFFDSLQFQN